MSRLFYISGLMVLLSLFGCGPDAKHDNPLDPVNGFGVSGVVYRSNGGVVSNAVVTASPNNIVVKTNAQGQYSLELEGGKIYVLTAASLPYYRSRSDTIAVPSDGLLKHNFILAGVPQIQNPNVLTCAVHTVWDGQLPIYVQPQCNVSLSEGAEVLDAYYQLSCWVRGKRYLPVKSEAVDQLSNKYFWSIVNDSIMKGDEVTFVLDSAGTDTHKAVSFVPEWLSWPEIIEPLNNATFILPDTMYWHNGTGIEYNPTIIVSIEVWKDTTVVWRKDTSNIQQLLCDAALAGGREYIWKVINTDSDGNVARTEAKFYVP